MTNAQGFPGDPDYVEGDNYQDADSLLGATIPSVSFPEIGTSVEGVIEAVDTAQQTSMDGEPLTFPDGSPRRQVILTLATKLRDDDDDDGRRRLFVKSGLTKAFRDAMKRAKAPGPRVGGTVTVEYVSDEKPTAKGLNPAKVYTVDYTPPA